MKTYPKNFKRLLVMAGSFICLVGIPACVTTYHHATPEAPFVINFEFLKPINVNRGEEHLLIQALERYAIRSQTRIFDHGHLIFPRVMPPIERMKTDKVTKGEHAPSPGSQRDHPLKTDNATANGADGPGQGGGDPETDRPIKTDQTSNRPMKTDYVSFETAQDLKDFINCIAGKGCPDRK